MPDDALARGQAFVGSGAALARFAARMAAGRPSTVVTIGGSVTYGMGASWWGSGEAECQGQVPAVGAAVGAAVSGGRANGERTAWGGSMGPGGQSPRPACRPAV